MNRDACVLGVPDWGSAVGRSPGTPMPEPAPSLHGRKSQGEQELPVSQQGRSPEAPRPQLDSRFLFCALEPAFPQQVGTQQSPGPGRQLPRDCLAWRKEEGYGRLGGSQPQGPRGDFAQVSASRLIPWSSPPLDIDGGAPVAQATQGLRRELKSEEVKSGLRVLTLSVPSAAGDKARPTAFSVSPHLSLWVTTPVSLRGSTEDLV